MIYPKNMVTLRNCKDITIKNSTIPENLKIVDFKYKIKNFVGLRQNQW